MANKTIPAIQVNEGNVGIGTTNPVASLEVFNSAASLPVLNLGGGEAGNAVSDLYILNSYNNNTGVGYAAKVIGVNISGSLTNQNIPIQRTTWGGVTSATAIALGTDGPRAGTQDNAFQIWTTNDASAGTALTQKFSVTSAGDVGIGTIAPAQKLDVNGAIIVGINNSYGAYTRTPGGVLKPWFATATANTFFYNTNVSGSIFWQNAADTATLMTLSEQGRLGINTNDPSGRLHVLDTVLYPPSLTWNKPAAAIIRSENGQIAFGSDDTTPYGIWQQVRTASSTARPLLLNPLGGNVGVGVRNPTKNFQVAGSLYWDYNGSSAEEHSVGIQRVVAAANGSYTEIGTLAASPNSIRATFEIFHHDCGTIEYSLFELIANYYTGTTTDWVQLPSRTQAHYAGAPNGVVVDARLQTTGGVVELRLRSIGGACAAMTVNVRIKSNTNLTESTGTGTGATVAGLLGFNRYEFPVTDNRFKATINGLFIKNNGFIGVGTTNPSELLHVDTAGADARIRVSAGTNTVQGGMIANTGTSLVYAGSITNHGFSLRTNDTDRVRIDTNGNVGIGIVSPIGKLTVQGNIEVNYNSITADTSVRRSFLTSHATINRGANISFGLLDGASGPAGMTVYNVAAAAGAFNSQFIAFNTHEGGVNEGERMRITQLGNVGIGTFTPLSLLSVGTAGSTTAANGITFGGEAASNIYRSSTNQIKTDGSFVVTNTLIVGGGENGVRILKDGSDSISSTLYLANAGNTRAYNFQQNAAGTNLALWGYNSSNAWQNLVNFNYNGNVGIGTTIPSGRLHVVSTTAGDTVLRADGTNGTLFSVVDDLSDSLMSVNNSAGLPVLEVFADDRIVMGQYGSGDLVVRNNKVGIGTTNPVNKLSVIGGASIGSNTYNVAAPSNGLIVQGNVGIGGTIPNCKLDVRGEMQVVSSSAYTTHFNYNDVGANFITTANGGTTYFRGSTNNITSMTVDGGGTVTTQYNTYLATVNGNVGIGITNPASKVHVSGSAQTIFRLDSSTTTNVSQFQIKANTDGVLFMGMFGGSAAGTTYGVNNAGAAFFGTTTLATAHPTSLLIGNVSNIPIVFGNNNIERMRIDSVGNIGIGTTNPLSLLAVGTAGSTTAANGITFGGDAQANIYRYAEDALATDGDFNAAGNVNSKNSRTATYSSINSGTNGTWYPLFTVADSTDATIYCNLRTYAHSSVSFIVARGYNLSNTHNITILNCQINPNGGYANVTGVRIKQDGGVEIQLSWSSGPIVNIGVQIIGTNYTPNLVPSLTPTANGTAVIDTVTLTNGMIRTLRDIITEAGSVGIGIANPTNKLHVVVTTPTGSRIQLGSISTNGLMNAGLVNDFLILTAPFNAVPASTSNNNAKWGIKMNGGSTDAPNVLEKSACIYAVSEEDSVGGAGYNRKVGLALHTSPFDLPNVERVRISNVGNVGIGSTNPAYKLDITGGDVNFASNSILRFGTVSVLNESSNANDIYANIRVIRNKSSTLNDGMYINYDSNGTTAAHLRFYANGATERMRIQANNGHVGIGTDNALGRLDVYDDTNAGHISFVRNLNTGSSAYTAMVFRRNGGNNGLVMFTNSSNRTTDGGAGNSTIRTDNGKLLLGANATTYHALETDGNVGIGLTNPVAARLHIKGNATDPVLRVEDASLLGAAGGTAGKTFVGWLPIMTGALSPADKVFIPLYK